MAGAKPKHLFMAQIPPKKTYVSKDLKTEIHREAIANAVKSTERKTGAVYTDELRKLTGCANKTITLWLSGNGFYKPFGARSKRWVRVETDL